MYFDINMDDNGGDVMMMVGITSLMVGIRMMIEHKSAKSCIGSDYFSLNQQTQIEQQQPQPQQKQQQHHHHQQQHHSKHGACNLSVIIE